MRKADMESYSSPEDTQSDRDDKQVSVSVPRGWNRILEKGAILYISPNKSRIRCREDLAQYLLLDGACKCGLECPLRIDDIFNFNPDIPSRLQENETVTSPHCIVSKKFSRFFPSGSQREGLEVPFDTESSRKKKRRGQAKNLSISEDVSEDTNGMIHPALPLSSPSKRPRKNPCQLLSGMNSFLVRYGHPNGGSRYMVPSEGSEDLTKVVDENIYDRSNEGLGRMHQTLSLDNGRRAPSPKKLGTNIPIRPAQVAADETSLTHDLKQLSDGLSHPRGFHSSTGGFLGSGLPQRLFQEGREHETSRGLKVTPSNKSDQYLNTSNEHFQQTNGSLSHGLGEPMTNVVSLGLASCVAMSVSATTDSDVERFGHATNMKTNLDPSQDLNQVAMRENHVVNEILDMVAPVSGSHSGSSRARTKNVVRRKPGSKASEVKSKAAKVELKEPLQQQDNKTLDNVSAVGGALIWNSLPGGTVPSQFASASMNFQTNAPVASQLSSGTSSSMSDPGCSLNSNGPANNVHSSISDACTSQALQQNVLGADGGSDKWPYSGMYNTNSPGVDNIATGIAKPTARGYQRGSSVTSGNHPVDSLCGQEIRSAVSLRANDQFQSEQNDRSGGVCNNRSVAKSVIGETARSDAPPNITLSPSLSNSLLQKDISDRTLGSFNTLGSIKGTLEHAGLSGKQIGDNVLTGATPASLSASVDPAEKESESKQQAKANVYWCSQTTSSDSSSLSPSASLPLSVTASIKENEKNEIGTVGLGQGKVWNKGHGVNRRGLGSAASPLSSPPPTSSCAVSEPKASVQETPSTNPRSSKGKTHHIQPNLPLMNLPATPTTSTQRELLNAPLPLNTQTPSVAGQSAAYMLQGADVSNATSIGQQMVLVRLVSQASTNSSTVVNTSTCSTTQGPILPTTYGIPATQSLYHSQLTNYALQGGPANPGQVFIMGNTHASQALQNLALQSGQGGKEDGLGSLVYQTGYSAHTIRSPTASLNYGGIPLQLMTISGSPVLARSQSQLASKPDPYNAMLQYYQKQVEISRMRSGQVLAPTPSLVHPLGTQISPSLGNSYIRIAPAFSTVSGKESVAQGKFARSADSSQSAAWVSNEKVKVPISMNTSHYPDIQPATSHSSSFSSKDSRNSSSPLSPKFEFSRLKNSSYSSLQSSAEPKTSALTQQSSVPVAVTALSPTKTQVVVSSQSQRIPKQEGTNSSVPSHNSQSNFVKPNSRVSPRQSPSRTPAGGDGSVNQTVAMPDKNVPLSEIELKEISGSSEQNASNHVLKFSNSLPTPGQNAVCDLKTSHCSNDQTLKGKTSVFDTKAAPKLPLSENTNCVEKVNELSCGKSVLDNSRVLTTDRSGEGFRSQEADPSAHKQCCTASASNCRVRTLPEGNVQDSISTNQSDLPRSTLDGSSAGVNEQSRTPPRWVEERDTKVKSSGSLAQGMPAVKRENTTSFIGCSQKLNCRDPGKDSVAERSLGNSDTQPSAKSHESEEMSLQCLEECSRTSSDSCAPSPKCPSKSSPLYFSEAKSKVLQGGDLVWGEFNGSPSWPGKVVNELDINKGPAAPGKVWVQWFGHHSYEQVNQNELKTLNEGLPAWNEAGKKHIESNAKRRSEHLDGSVDQVLSGVGGVVRISNHLSGSNSSKHAVLF